MDAQRNLATLVVAGSVAVTGAEMLDLPDAPAMMLVAWCVLVTAVAAWVNVTLERRAYRQAAERAQAREDRVVARDAADALADEERDVAVAEAIGDVITGGGRRWAA